MLIYDAVITGSFSYNGVNISNVTGSEASINALNQFTSSYNTGSFTGSFIGNGSGLLGVVSASFASNADLLDGKNSTEFAITGSNIFTGIQYITSTSNPNGFGASASIYTDGGLRVTRDAYVSGTIFVNNLSVFGTQSINYITSSQLNISTNIISVNTDTPSIRFGGLSVYDSGSTGLTGSMLWDSERDHWVYSNPSGSSYNGGMMISGPRNTGSLGTEQGTLNNVIVKGQGGDHVTSSQMIDDGTTIRIPGNLQVTGSTILASALSGTSATFSAAITPLVLRGTNVATMWTEYYYNTSTLSGYIGSGDGLLSGANASDFIIRSQADIVLATGNNRRMTISSSTGAATFSSNLTVNGVYNVPSTSYFIGNAAAGYRFNNAADTLNLFVIRDSGNVGIGTSSPSSLLHLQSSAAGGQNLRIQTSIAAGRNYVQFANGSGDMGYFGFGGPDNKFYIINQKNDDMLFYTNDLPRMTITSGGTVQPGANGTQDLGTSSLRWATVYTSDLSMSNGIGDYTIVEGEEDLFLYNNKTNKVFKFLLAEVDPSIAPPKKS